MINLQRRLDRIFSFTGVDAALIVNTGLMDSNFLYLTGFPGGSFEGSVLIAGRSGVTLLTSMLEYQMAESLKPRGMEVLGVTKMADVRKEMKERLAGKRIGINGSFLPYNVYARISKITKPRSISDISAAFTSARQIKDSDEIELIGIANNIVKKAFSGIEESLEAGMTERDAARKFNSAMMQYGADVPSFDTIVCFGKNSASPHHMPTMERLSGNSLVLIDAGARYMGYCSDVTRTFIFKPEKKTDKYKRMRMMYETVEGAQQEALDHVRVGIYADKIHRIAERRINTSYGGAFKGRFIHALGHSVGIDVHDGPGFSPSEHYRLKENMVISNEPGVYVDGFGGVRIEDDLVVMKNGARYL